MLSLVFTSRLLCGSFEQTASIFDRSAKPDIAVPMGIIQNHLALKKHMVYVRPKRLRYRKCLPERWKLL